MFLLPSASGLREHQIEQYEKLIEEATTIDAIIFLEKELTKFLKTSI